jgi:hypothetical protein
MAGLAGWGEFDPMMGVCTARIRGTVAAFGLAACLLAAASPLARAQNWASQLAGNDPGLLSVGAGMYDFLHNYKAGEARAEYDFAHGYYFVKPMIGVFGTNHESAFGYAGFILDLHLGNHFVIVPNASVGYYHQGNGKNLGEAFEFKTGARFDYRFDDASRIGIAFDHISNAGFSSHNPGEENLLLMISFPIGPW